MVRKSRSELTVKVIQFFLLLHRFFLTFWSFGWVIWIDTKLSFVIDVFLDDESILTLFLAFSFYQDKK